MRIGIDLGGTKIEGIAVASDGVVLWRNRVQTPFEYPSLSKNYHAILQAICRMVERIEAETGLTGSVGIGAPGSISSVNGGIKNSNTKCLNGQPLREDLQVVLDRPVKLANDADCMALSEACDGAGADASNVLGVILGTGVGGGLVINKTLLQGPNGIAGEWGHNAMPGRFLAPNALARTCYCGAENCIETWLSGAGLRNSYQQCCTDSSDSGFTDREISVPKIVQRATNGDQSAALAIDQYIDQLAGALAMVINIVDPDLIVLAGGLSNIEAFYTEVPQRWSSAIFSDQVETRLVRAKHGDSSGVRGAAWLWPLS